MEILHHLRLLLTIHRLNLLHHGSSGKAEILLRLVDSVPKTVLMGIEMGRRPPLNGPPSKI